MALDQDHWIKRLLPRSLLGRSLLIIVSPLVLLQVVAAFIFFEDHWDKVSRRLSLGVAGDVGAIADLLRRNPSPADRSWVLDVAQHRFAISADFRDGAILKRDAVPSAANPLDPDLAAALDEALHLPYRFDTEAPDRRVVIEVQLPEGVLSAEMSRKRLYSSTTYIFVLWMVGTSMLLLGVATVFMRNQVKPIRRLAAAANAFGKGRDVPPTFKPEGASEVRQAAAAFLNMRERIQRNIQQRTDMLSGVSHDLRTPLTRMKLQLAMLGDDAGAEALKGDVDEMERMLNAYLDFARGAGTEPPKPTSLTALLGEVVANARRGLAADKDRPGTKDKAAAVDLHTEGEIVLPLRAQAFRRCVANLLDNALRYGDHVAVRAGRRRDETGAEVVEVIVDDDGPGVPVDKRSDVFRPFFRLDGSRNPVTGGVGLGLSIVRDVVRGHGGDIVLDDAPIGGLRVRVRLPV